MSSSPDIVTLFERTLTSVNDDDEDAWAAIRELQRLGTREIFDAAARWLREPDPLLRMRGADVLAQFGVSSERSNVFQADARDALLGLLARETQPEPIASAIFALGHIADPSGLAAARDFVVHPSDRVRFAVAFAAGARADEPANVETLMRLMQDADVDVRDWATFGLGQQSDADSGAIRDALAARLDDPSLDVRIEAMVGCARRGDLRALRPIVEDLRRPDGATAGTARAAQYLLGMADAPDDWRCADYVAALRAKFGAEAIEAASAAQNPSAP